MKRGDLLAPMALGLAVIVSALIVIKTKHENRTLVSELERQRAQREHLQAEWGQLQLEEATLAQHGRVEQLARDQLNMAEPLDYVIVKAHTEAQP